MTENVKKLLEIVSGNKEPAAKVGRMGKAEIVTLAREPGMELTEADFTQNCALADDEPDQVVGGVSVGDHVKTDSAWCGIAPAAVSLHPPGVVR